MPAVTSLCVTSSPSCHFPAEWLSEFRGLVCELPPSVGVVEVYRFELVADGIKTIHQASGLETQRHARMDGVELAVGHLGIILRPGQTFSRRHHNYTAVIHVAREWKLRGDELVRWYGWQ